MRRKRGISFGTMLMICLSVAVLIGSAWVLGRMGGSEWTQFDAGELISAMHGSLAATDAPVNTPVPQATIKTTTVTLAPAMPDGEKTATQAPAYHSFTMTLGGQLAFQSDVSDSVFDINSKQFDYASVVQEIATQVYADLNICTLPHLIIENGGQYADVSTDSQVLEAIKYLGVDRVLMNHGNVLDKGEEGLDATLHKLQEYGIGYAGVRNTDVDGNMAFYTVNDVNIAILGYAESVSSKTYENAMQSESLSMLDMNRAAEDIKNARNQGADVVLVSVWWGNAEQNSVTDHQKDVARQLCQAGADVILGSGTDATLPVEWMDAVDAGGQVRRALCVYSLGTLLGEKRDTRSQVCSAFVHLRISVNSANGVVGFDSVTYTPTYTWKQEVDGKVRFRVLPSTQAAPAQMSQRQTEIMGRALTLITQVMEEGPAVMRGQ